MLEKLRAQALDGIWAAGMMSGTSLDGVDVALLRSDGEQIFEFGPSAYHPYTQAEQGILRAALGSWPGTSDTSKAARMVEAAHIAALENLPNPALIGFHGQTLAHDPAGRGTHQAGNGAVVAKAAKVPVAWDFRSHDVAMGGQGAPLAPFFHFALAQYLGLKAPLVFLNLGGVGNMTWVNPTAPTPDAPDALLAFDTGPANAPINDLMQRHFGLPFDKSGVLAAQGAVESVCIQHFLKDTYFTQKPPKSLDRDAFATLKRDLAYLPALDALATASEAAAMAVAQGLLHCPMRPTQIILCGGGRKNADLINRLQRMIDIPMQDCDELGLDGDMIEAQAFAFLAVRSLRGLPLSSPTTTAVITPVSGGKISMPEQ